MREYACGIIPLRLSAGEWHVLVVRQQRGGHWSFPKGHSEPGESPLTTAERELFEETRLHVVRLLSPEPLRECYRIAASGIDKVVDYFVAEVAGDIVLQSVEIADSQWLPLEHAAAVLTFPQVRDIYVRACAMIKRDKRH